MPGSTLNFIIPVRNKLGVQDWPRAMNLLEVTVERALKQDGGKSRVIISASQGDPLPGSLNDSRVTVLESQIPYTPLPTRGSIRTDAVHQDMGERMSRAINEVDMDGYIMKLDWDDLVSPVLAGKVLSGGADAYLLDKGYIFDQSGFAYLIKQNMYQYCGSTVIVAADLFRVPEGGAHSKRFKRQVLGGHRSCVRWLKEQELDITLIDEPAVAYRREWGENASASRSAKELAEALEPDNHEEIPQDEMLNISQGLSRGIW